MGSADQTAENVSAAKRGISINIPTILSIVTVCASSVVFVVGKVGDIDKKANDALRESEVNRAEIKRVEANQIVAQRDVRDDLKDISRKIDTLSDRLYDRTGTARPATREWTK